MARLVSLVLGYPMAYYLARAAREGYENLLLALVVLPYWASFLVRVYAIKLPLAKGDIAPTLVGLLPFVRGEPSLLYNAFSAQLGLVHLDHRHRS